MKKNVTEHACILKFDWYSRPFYVSFLSLGKRAEDEVCKSNSNEISLMKLNLWDI